MSIKNCQIAIIFLFVLITSSCGFKPVHDYQSHELSEHQSDQKYDLREVQFELSPGNLSRIDAQNFRKELHKNIKANSYNATHKFIAKIIPNIAQSIALVDDNGYALRYQIVASLKYDLNLISKDNASECRYFPEDKKLNSITSYNVAESEYATHIAKQNAIKEALNVLSKELIMSIHSDLVFSCNNDDKNFN